MNKFRHSAIVGLAEFKPCKLGPAMPSGTSLEQMAELTAQALADAGLQLGQIDGLVTGSLVEAETFVPATVAEYLGLRVRFAERMDLGGASAVSGVIRAAMAVEMGLAETVLVLLPSGFVAPPAGADQDSGMDFGASSGHYGSPQAEFEIPYGHLAQNTAYGLIAQRYAAVYGYDPVAAARIAVDQRVNACANPMAIFHDKPISVEEVLASRMIAPPLRLLEIVMPVWGGGAVIVARADGSGGWPRRPARITGVGEYLAVKSAAYAEDMLDTPIRQASQQAFAMAGTTPAAMDLAQIYDCYTITVILTLEDAGFCAKGEGMRFVREHDLTWRGDFPVNTHGGQLGFGQPGQAGGMTQVVEAVRQLRGEAGGRQLRRCERVYVSGTGGLMSEQSALILEGA